MATFYTSMIANGARAVSIGGGDHTCAASCVAIYVGTTGDLVVNMKDGTTTTFSSVPAGCIIPVQPASVDDTTGASNMVELYMLANQN